MGGKQRLGRVLDTKPCIFSSRGIFHKSQILEVGCGHGLPGIYCACEFMPKRVVLQDFNEEVIERVSKPNIELNQSKIHLHC